MPANANANIVPEAVFLRNGAAVADMHIDEHAEQVAGIMISTDATDGTGMFMNGIAPTGVATGADLYSSAYNVPTLPGQPEAALSAQHIALQDSGNVRAINFSFGEFPTGGHTLNGNSLLTLFVDWSARVHDVLYVVAGNQGNMIPVPKDQFNGMTIARSSKVGAVYRQVSAGNTYDEDAEGDERVSIDLLAPGDGIEVAQLGGAHAIVNGTSFAAPHVTGTVALLQQFANQQIMNVGAPRWKGSPGAGQSAPAQRHEVMKAVLMNSADKLIDDGTVMVNGSAVPVGGLLGMERTVLKQDGTSTWLDSIAYGDSLEEAGGFYPLDIEMGAGHLNARRALQQFRPGEYESDAGDVPPIGWDYGHTTGLNDINRYPLAGTLLANHFISITLAWDRHVEFDVDGGTIGEYDIGDTFQPSTATFPTPDSDDLINNLDIFLLPKGSAIISQAVAQSVSAEGTLQHIFFQIPQTGEYEIWVRQFDADISSGQDYALAWWYGLAPPLAGVPGDYSGDGIVGPEDYDIWVSNFGNSVTPGMDADGNGDGIVDAADYVIWRKAFSSGSGSIASVPEPASLTLFVVGLILLSAHRKGRMGNSRAA